MVKTGDYSQKARLDQRSHETREEAGEGACSTCGPGSDCTKNHSKSGLQSHPKSSPKQRGESSERDHAALHTSEVERLEVQRVREGFTAWCKTQSSDLTVAVETGCEEKAIRTQIRELVGCVTTTKELGSVIRSVEQNPTVKRFHQRCKVTPHDDEYE